MAIRRSWVRRATSEEVMFGLVEAAMAKAGSMPAICRAQKEPHNAVPKGVLTKCSVSGAPTMPSRVPRIYITGVIHMHATCNPVCLGAHTGRTRPPRTGGAHPCGMAYVVEARMPMYPPALQGCGSSTPGAPGGPAGLRWSRIQCCPAACVHRWTHEWPSRQAQSVLGHCHQGLST